MLPVSLHEAAQLRARRTQRGIACALYASMAAAAGEDARGGRDANGAACCGRQRGPRGRISRSAHCL